MPYFRTHLRAKTIHLVEIGGPDFKPLCGRDLTARKWYNWWLPELRQFATRLDQIPYRYHRKICKTCAAINAK